MTLAEKLEQLEDLEKRAAGAPWDPDWCYGACRHISKNVDDDAFYSGEGSGWDRYDGQFVAQMRNALPTLLRLVRAGEVLAQLAQHVELAFTCDPQYIGDLNRALAAWDEAVKAFEEAK